MKSLFHFAYLQAASCLFPVVIFIALALSKLIQVPFLPRYDFILLICVITQVFMLLFKLESFDELKVICLFHIIGLALELFKVHMGSWSYPDAAYSKLFGVPLYSGFMYASVASYICQSWRRLNLQITGWCLRPSSMSYYRGSWSMNLSYGRNEKSRQFNGHGIMVIELTAFQLL